MNFDRYGVAGWRCFSRCSAKLPAPVNLRVSLISLLDYTGSVEGGKGDLLQCNKIPRLGQADCLQRALGPGYYLVINDLLRLLARGSLDFLNLFLSQNDLSSISKDDTSETDVLQSIDRGLNLSGILSGAELGIKRLLQEIAKDWVPVWVQQRTVAVRQQCHDAQGRRQQYGRRGYDRCRQ